MANLKAVIDIGSSAIRILVADIHDDGTWTSLDKAEQNVSLGSDVFVNGSISRQRMRQCLQILHGYREMLSAWSIPPESVSVIATSALREARNRDQFIDRVALRTGFAVNVIEGVETSYLTFSAVRFALQSDWKTFSRSNSIIAEIGAGSTEIILLRRGSIAGVHSFHLGTVRIEQLTSEGQLTHRKLKKLLSDSIESMAQVLSSEFPIARTRRFIALGSDARLAIRYVGKKISDYFGVIDAESFYAFRDKIIEKPLGDLVKDMGISYAEAEHLVPSILMYGQLLQVTSAKQIVVPFSSIREGMLLALAGDPSGRMHAEFTDQIRASAFSLGAKYYADKKHAEQVSMNALHLFDLLTNEHGLNRHHRLLLEIAAILHDIGKYVSPSAHHKHSQYLVQNSEIFGLNRSDMRILSTVIRYHRKALPNRSHPEFTALPREERLIVMKLAAILRTADALDTSHSSGISNFELEKNLDEYVIKLPSPVDISAERHSLSVKGNLFEEVFGVTIRLES